MINSNNHNDNNNSNDTNIDNTEGGARVACRAFALWMEAIIYIYIYIYSLYVISYYCKLYVY